MFSSKRCKQNSRKHELFEVGRLTTTGFFLAGAFTLFISPEHSESAQRNGFSIEDPLIPLEEILGGGPPRDGIPSIDSRIYIFSRRGRLAVSRQPDHWPGYRRRYPGLSAGHFKQARDCQRHSRGSSCFNHILPPLWNLVSAFYLKINHEWN